MHTYFFKTLHLGLVGLQPGKGSCRPGEDDGEQVRAQGTEAPREPRGGCWRSNRPGWHKGALPWTNVSVLSESGRVATCPELILLHTHPSQEA